MGHSQGSVKCQCPNRFLPRQRESVRGFACWVPTAPPTQATTVLLTYCPNFKIPEIPPHIGLEDISRPETINDSRL